jgi:hypothetical protein
MNITCKLLSAAITFANVLGVAYMPAIAAPRHHHVVRRYPRLEAPPVRPHPQQHIACTVLGCRPVPPGCDFYTRTYDIVVCPPGIEPFR